MIYERIEDVKSVSIPENARFIALDYGEAKIGIALSDITRTVANPHSVYKRRNMSKDLGYLNELITEQKVALIVLGLPITMDGAESEACEKVRHFAKKLVQKTSMAVLLVDERLTTAEASRMLRETDMTRKKRDAIDDKLAATILLQHALTMLYS